MQSGLLAFRSVRAVGQPFSQVAFLLPAIQPGVICLPRHEQRIRCLSQSPWAWRGLG